MYPNYVKLQRLLVYRLLEKQILLMLIVVLFAQHGMALLATNYKVANAKALNSDDLTLICSGKRMKWISLSQTEKKGYFVFVEPHWVAPDLISKADNGVDVIPNNAELQQSIADSIEVDCINKVQSDVCSAIEAPQLNMFVTFRAFFHRVYAHYQSQYAALRYLAQPLRGPPSNPSLF